MSEHTRGTWKENIDDTVKRVLSGNILSDDALVLAKAWTNAVGTGQHIAGEGFVQITPKTPEKPEGPYKPDTVVAILSPQDVKVAAELGFGIEIELRGCFPEIQAALQGAASRDAEIEVLKKTLEDCKKFKTWLVAWRSQVLGSIQEQTLDEVIGTWGSLDTRIKAALHPADSGKD